MNDLYSGRDVRISRDLRVWVRPSPGCLGLLLGGLRKREWVEVSASEISINMYHYGIIRVACNERASIRDLPIGQRQFSHLLGIVRLDTHGAKEIRADPQSLGYPAAEVCVNFAQKEVVDGEHFVYPFSAFATLRLAPQAQLVSRRPGTGSRLIDVSELPIAPEALASQMSLPVEQWFRCMCQGI